MLTKYDIDLMAMKLGVPWKEVLLCCYEQGFELSYVCESLAAELRFRG